MFDHRGVPLRRILPKAVKVCQLFDKQLRLFHNIRKCRNGGLLELVNNEQIGGSFQGTQPSLSEDRLSKYVFECKKFSTSTVCECAVQTVAKPVEQHHYCPFHD